MRSISSRRWSAPLRAAAALLVALVVAPLCAGDGAPSQGVAPSALDDEALDRLVRLHMTHTERVRLVLLPTSVTDRRGRYVRGLAEDDFRVFEDQVEQPIRYFSAESREPVSIAFLLDVSGSMRQLDKLQHAKEAVRFFVDQLRPDDRFGLIAFADEQVAWITDFTDDRERFLARLNVQEGWGQTALHDAVAAAPELVDASVDGRKGIVLITDGVDNRSRLTMDAALDIARRVDVPVYTIGFLTLDEAVLEPGTVTTNLEVLAAVSDETGGRLFAVRDPDDLKEAVNRLDEELRFQYVLGYHARENGDPGFRRVQVEVDRRRVRVQTRAGYYLSGGDGPPVAAARVPGR